MPPQTNADHKAIVANLETRLFDGFLAPNLAESPLADQIALHKPGGTCADLIAEINARSARVLITAWGSVLLCEDILEHCPTLQYLCHLTGEMRRIVPRPLIEKGLIVTNWGDSISDSVAESAMFLVLASLRQATRYQMMMHVRKGWREDGVESRSLLGRSVGIHGFGNVAQAFVRLIEPFGCRLSAYCPPMPDSTFEQAGVRRAETIEEVFSDNDVVVEVEGLTPQTEGMVGMDLLGRLAPGAVFVNVGRGKVVREADLCEVALRGEVFMGLDVFETEPLPADSPIRGLENVVLCPHQSGPTQDRWPAVGRHGLDNIRAFLAGRDLKSVIDLARYDRMT